MVGANLKGFKNRNKIQKPPQINKKKRFQSLKGQQFAPETSSKQITKELCREESLVERRGEKKKGGWKKEGEEEKCG